MNSDLQLTPLSVDVLVDGLKIDYNIYYYSNGEFILLCKNVELTASLVKKLKIVVAEHRNIYVPTSKKSKILSESAYLTSVQHELELAVGYTDVKTKACSMLELISANNILSMETSNALALELSNKVDVIDNSLILQCINGIRQADEYLFTHSINVAMLNGLLGKWLGYSHSDIDTLVKIGLLHDIGKLRINPIILNKPARLTKDEFEIMKNHSTNSYDLLVESGELNANILEAVKHHHEKMNGSGYPDGMHSSEIPIFARITSVSDVYDAMVASRVYKRSHSPFEILHEFSIGRFSDLDIELVDVFLKNMPLELTGKLVVLSNGSVGKVLYVNPLNYTYPIVRVDNEVITTNAKVHCVSMYIDKV